MLNNIYRIELLFNDDYVGTIIFNTNKIFLCFGSEDYKIPAYIREYKNVRIEDTVNNIFRLYHKNNTIISYICDFKVNKIYDYWEDLKENSYIKIVFDEESIYDEYHINNEEDNREVSEDSEDLMCDEFILNLNDDL
jgi:hypothetical protein